MADDTKEDLSRLGDGRPYAQDNVQDDLIPDAKSFPGITIVRLAGSNHPLIALRPTWRIRIKGCNPDGQRFHVVAGTAVTKIEGIVSLVERGDPIIVPLDKICTITNMGDANFCFWPIPGESTRIEILPRDKPRDYLNDGGIDICDAGEQQRAATEEVGGPIDQIADVLIAALDAGGEDAVSVSHRFAQAGWAIGHLTVSAATNASTSISPPVSLTELPNTAPRLWANKRENDPNTPTGFIHKYYDLWLPHTLAQQDLQHLDPALYTAYTSRTRADRHPEERVTFAPKKPRSDKLDDAELGRRQREQSNASKAKARSKTVHNHRPRLA